MRGKCQRVARPAQRACRTHGLLNQRSQSFYETYRAVIGGVNVRLLVVILPFVVEYQHTEWKSGVLIFTKNRLPSLEPSRKKCRMDHAQHICTYPENLVKIGPVNSEIIRPLEDR